MTRLHHVLVAAAAALAPLAPLAAQQPAPWMLGPFSKPADVNPVLSPSPAATFRSPLSDSLVRWEAFATFNPAAVVRDGKVFVLYRAEDASGESIIGGHTSRIGLAVSNDGLLLDGGFTVGQSPSQNPKRKLTFRDTRGQECQLANGDVYRYDTDGDVFFRYDDAQLKSYMQSRCSNLKF